MTAAARRGLALARWWGGLDGRRGACAGRERRGLLSSEKRESTRARLTNLPLTLLVEVFLAERLDAELASREVLAPAKEGRRSQKTLSTNN
jgi:hypothetical protein